MSITLKLNTEKVRIIPLSYGAGNSTDVLTFYSIPRVEPYQGSVLNENNERLKKQILISAMFQKAYNNKGLDEYEINDLRIKEDLGDVLKFYEEKNPVYKGLLNTVIETVGGLNKVVETAYEQHLLEKEGNEYVPTPALIELMLDNELIHRNGLSSEDDKLMV